MHAFGQGPNACINLYEKGHDCRGAGMRKPEISCLWFAFALDVLRHQEMLTVPDHITELGDPVAEDNHTGLFGQLEVYLDMAVAVDEVIHIGVVLDIFLGEEDEVLAVLAHIGRLLVVGTLQARVLRPVQAKPHAPAGMHVGECPLLEVLLLF